MLVSLTATPDTTAIVVGSWNLPRRLVTGPGLAGAGESWAWAKAGTISSRAANRAERTGIAGNPRVGGRRSVRHGRTRGSIMAESNGCGEPACGIRRPEMPRSSRTMAPEGWDAPGAALVALEIAARTPPRAAGIRGPGQRGGGCRGYRGVTRTRPSVMPRSGACPE